MHFYLLVSEFCSFSTVLFSSFMCRVQNESPIRVLNADMFATPLTTFELPFYVVELAHVLVEAPSPPPSRTRHFNKTILDFLDLEAEQGEDSDRHDSLSSWLRLVHLKPPSICNVCV